MSRVREPLVAPVLAFIVGIVLARFAGLTLIESAAAAATLLILAAIAFLRNSRILGRAALLLSFVALGAFIARWQAPGPPPELDAAQGELVELSGCVVEPPRFTLDREQLVLELAPNARVRVNLYPREGEPLPSIRYGQRVSIEARVRRPRNFRNEGSFDVEHFLARQQIYWTASGRTGAPVRIEPEPCGSRIHAAVYGIRTWMLDRIDGLFGEDAPKVAALLIGESAKLDRDWTDSFRRTGTYHALVVSGTHVTLLAGLLTVFLRALYVPQLPALLLTASLTWLYAALAGGSIPVLRAAAGFTLFLICRFVYRKARLLNILAAVALGFLLYDAEQLFDASFVLSFGALAAIAAIALPLDERFLEPYRAALRHITDRRHDIRLEPKSAAFRVELRLLAETIHLWTKIPFDWMLRALAFVLRPVFSVAALILVSASVQLALAVPFVLYFHRFALSAVLANVGVVLFLEFAIAIGFVATLTALPPLAWLTRWLINTAAALSAWHLQWEPDFRVPDPPSWLAILIVTSLAAAAWLLRRRLAWGLPALAACAAVGAILIVHPFSVAARTGELELTAMDVGQGDGLLVVFPDGTRMAVDSGGIPQFGPSRTKPLDIGESVIAPYLWTRSIQSLDILVVTHAHADHMGGAAALIDNFRPRELWISGLGRSEAFDALLRHAKDRGVTVRRLRRGDKQRFGPAEVIVVAPGPEAWNEDAPSNNDSLTLLARFGERTFLLPGDAERSLEDEMLAAEAIGKIDVLKIAHHGGRTSTTFDFVEHSKPAFAIISVGEGNRYRHPHPEVLDRLAATRTAVLRTDLDGRITIRTDGRRISLETYRWTHSR